MQMKQIITAISLVTLIALPARVLAQGNQAGQQQNTTQPLTNTETVTPRGNQVQNQVTTQNQGEDSQLQVATQEQEHVEEGSGSGVETRSRAATQNMSIVAQKVQEMLQIRTNGGIGEQVRQVAQEQNQAQTLTQEHVNKLESRKGISRALFGPDYSAIKNLKALLEQNRLRIQQLEELQNQLSNRADISAVQETVLALQQEDTSLQELINTEEQTLSMFGWLLRLFAR